MKRSSSRPAKRAEDRLLQAEAEPARRRRPRQAPEVGEPNLARRRTARGFDREVEPAPDDRLVKAVSQARDPVALVHHQPQQHALAGEPARPHRPIRVSSARRSPSGASSTRPLKDSISSIRSSKATSRACLLGKCLHRAPERGRAPRPSRSRRSTLPCSRARRTAPARRRGCARGSRYLCSSVNDRLPKVTARLPGRLLRPARHRVDRRAEVVEEELAPAVEPR